MKGYEEINGKWDYSTLPANVMVGTGCYLERKDSFGRFQSKRNPGLVIGDNVRVYTWTTFNIDVDGFVQIGDDSVLVGPVFMCAESILVGNRVILSYNVTIADSDFHPHDPELRIQDAIANAPSGDRSRRPGLVSRPVVIEDDAWVGIGAIILKGVRVGAGARIGAGSVVTRDVPPGCIVEGNPGKVVQP